MAHIKNNPPTAATPLPQWGYKAMLLGAAAIWGLSTCIIKDTVAVFPPAWLMGIRFFLAGILLLIVFRKRVAQCLNREMLVAGAIIGLHMAVSARLSDGRDALALSAIQFIVAGLIGMAWGAATEGTPNLTTFADPSVFAGMVYLVVFASCGALCFQNIGIKHVPAAPAALLLSTESLFGVTFAVLFFGDTLTITAIIGFALIAFGIAVSETFPLKKGSSQ